MCAEQEKNAILETKVEEINATKNDFMQMLDMERDARTKLIEEAVAKKLNQLLNKPLSWTKR